MAITQVSLGQQRLSNEQLNATIAGLSEREIYIFCRGTKTKSGVIANKYNLQDRNISHIGIGYIENNIARIYNVNDITDHSRSALYVDSIQSFLNVKDAVYFAIWRLSPDPKALSLLKRLCSEYSSRKITFDYQFNISHDDTLYCSEFVYELLGKIIPDLNINPTKVVLANRLYESFLQRKELVYFSADFFQISSRFKKVFETTL